MKLSILIINNLGIGVNLMNLILFEAEAALPGKTFKD